MPGEKKRRKKKAARETTENSQYQLIPKKLTIEEKAEIIRDRLANRPVVVWRYPNGKFNMRFIIVFVIMIVAMAVALYFFSRNF